MTRDRTVKCPKCRAGLGEPCKSRNGATTGTYHAGRRAEAALLAYFSTGVHPATYSETKAAWGTVTGWRFTCPNCLATSHVYQKEDTAKLIASEHNCTGKVTA